MTSHSCDTEGERLAALRAYGILDTAPEAAFDHVTAVVTRLFNAPISAVTLVDAERQWFKSAQGLDISQTPRDVSFCTQAMMEDDVMVVSDAAQDPRFANNALVTGAPHIRFYAGAPLRSPEGHSLGALCVIDTKPRRFNRSERKMLMEMAALVEDELLLRRAANELRHELLASQPTATATPANGETNLARRTARSGQKRRHGSEIGRPNFRAAAPAANGSRFRHLVELADDAIFVCDLEGRFVEVNSAACRLFGYETAEFLRLGRADLEVGFTPARGRKRWQEMVVGEQMTMESLNRRKDQSVFWAELRVSVVDTGEGRYLLVLARDITERKQAEVLLVTRARQQKAVAELGQHALRGEGIQTLLDEAVIAVSETLEIEICRVLEHLPQQGEFVTRAGLNLPAQERGMVAATDSREHAAGYVVSTGEPLIIENAHTNPRFRPSPWLKASGAVSGLHISIGGDGSHCPRYGVLAAYTRESRAFTDDDVYFVQSVANVLAAAVMRQRNEDALRAVEARYQRIAAHTPGVVYQYLLKPDGKLAIPFISESCRQLYGREPEEIQARPELALEAIHPDDLPGLEQAIYHTKRSLTPLHWQGRLRRPNGEIRWVRFDSRPERLPDGGVICDGLIVDITEEETRKEALRQTERRFRLANLHAPFPIMLFAEGGEVLLVNDAWTHTTGYMAEELRTVEDWLQRAYTNEQERESIRHNVDNLWQHIGVAEFGDRRIRCASGEHRIWQFRCANLDRLPDGRWLHLLSAIDVTEQKEHEATLNLAKEEAERANAAKSVFLSRMSHELRTPLNAILGFGQLLELGELDREGRQSVDQILQGGRHLLSLVDEVLDLARVESGEIDLRSEPISLQKLARECVDLVARSAQARGIVCQMTIPRGQLQPVLADEHRLRQVLLNLLSNAIKYSHGGDKVMLSFHRVEDDRVCLKITDTGPGISTAGLAQLFVPFERLGQELTETEGTGLGLVISKQLVEAMGGRIGVESELGHGSTFWIELPTAPAEEPPLTPEPAAPLARPTNGVQPPKRQATVLYIEDNASNVRVVKILIERLRPEWHFLSAGDGPTGLRMVQEHQPGVVLLDLQLPGLKGDAVLTKIREDATTRDLPVLLLSADAMAHSRERLLALGANEYLPKPFNVHELLQKLDQFLG